MITFTRTLKESKIRAYKGDGGENPVGFVSGAYLAVPLISIMHNGRTNIGGSPHQEYSAPAWNKG